MTDEQADSPGGEVGTVHIATATPDPSGVIRPPAPVALQQLLAGTGEEQQ